MRVPALGEAATHLCWLSPCAASLAALARPGVDAWSAVRFDPGAVLLIARHTPSPELPSALFADAPLLERALLLLDQAPLPPPDWHLPVLRPIWQSSAGFARLAGHLSERLGRGQPAAAWLAGLLAPLGWLAAAAVGPALVGRCLDDSAHGEQPLAVQRQHWGLDHAGIARRLARRWCLPGWLTAVAGYLGLPVTLAQSLGADPIVFQVVQLAVSLAQRHGSRLNLAVGATPAELLAGLGRPAAEWAALEEEAAEVLREPLPELSWKAPSSEPLLRDVLTLAAENSRLRDCDSVRDLEGDLDELYLMLADQRRGEAERLREQKLSALAEFAAGAGHEINNPLAVISGQAQYLLGHEPDAPRQKALQTIVQQAQRIHQTLRDLMQFARPSRPRPHLFDLGDLVREVLGSLADLAAQRRVQVSGPASPGEERHSVLADRGQAAAALLCLLRNAIEAAPPEGWVRVRLEPRGERVEVAVEDSGDGLRALGVAQQEHIFDPFYSGRLAGRGRGLGLPTAWRLARENGGEVRWDQAAVGVTRFLLSLPRADTEAPSLPQSEPIPA